jgi:hypothetical protein
VHCFSVDREAIAQYIENILQEYTLLEKLISRIFSLMLLISHDILNQRVLISILNAIFT